MPLKGAPCAFAVRSALKAKVAGQRISWRVAACRELRLPRRSEKRELRVVTRCLVADTVTPDGAGANMGELHDHDHLGEGRTQFSTGFPVCRRARCFSG